MNEHESAKFERVGGSYILMVVGVAVVLPLAAALIACATHGDFSLSVLLPLTLVFGIMVWIVLPRYL